MGERGGGGGGGEGDRIIIIIITCLAVPEVNLTVSNKSVSHANEAEDVVLTCEAAGLSREAYRVVWMRNGAVVEGMTQTQYVIRPAQQDVGFGNYTCLVDDGSGNYSRSLLIQEKGIITGFFFVPKHPRLVGQMSRELMM